MLQYISNEPAMAKHFDTRLGFLKAQYYIGSIQNLFTLAQSNMLVHVIH